MRSEREMFDLILGFAKNDPRVRGVIMNGSRANPKARRDVFQDYDIVYLVDDLKSFVSDHSWVDVFGQKLVYQLPDGGKYLYPPTGSGESFGYLMQFTDGNRLDLSLAKKELFKGYCFDDRLSVVLMDKDGFLPELLPPDESSHYIKKPNRELFEEVRCEFWWVAPYVSKGLWRGQLLFAQHHFEQCLRPMLLHMLSWLAGWENGFAVSQGKCGDKLKEYLPLDLWQEYLACYAPCEEKALWQALFAACRLFTKASGICAEKLGFSYDSSWDENLPAFLLYTKKLPRDAADIDFSLERN